jgi:hypothetical protein
LNTTLRGFAKAVSTAAVLCGVVLAGAAVSAAGDDDAQRARAAVKRTELPSGPRDQGLAAVLSPRRRALVTSRRIRVTLRVARGAAYRVWVNRREVTRRFKRRGPLRWGTLGARGVARGSNKLVVRARAGGGRWDFDAVRFVVARPGRGLVSRLKASVARGSGPGARGVVQARFRLVRPLHGLRVTLNGRNVTDAFGQGGRRRATLGADEGLRFGRNRLRVLAWSAAGRYQRRSASVLISRRAPLAGAGAVGTVLAGRTVRLNGHATQATASGTGARRLVYRWRIIRAPRGSRARLRGATRRRPTLVARRSGRYRIALTVAARSRRPTAVVGSRAASTVNGGGPATTDVAEVDVAPNLPPIGAAFDTAEADPDSQSGRSLTITGDARSGVRQAYGIPSRQQLVVMLDRVTLQPVGGTPATPETQADFAALAAKARADTGNPVVVFQISANQSTVGRLDDTGPAPKVVPYISNNGRALSSGSGSPGPAGGIAGYLQQDNNDFYTPVVPSKVLWNTQWGPSESSITVAGQTWSGQLPAGQSGFLVMAVDRYTLAPLAGYPKTYSGTDDNAMASMGADLTQLRLSDALRFVQAIGTPRPATPHWNDPMNEIERGGRSGQLFVGLDGSQPTGRGGYYAAAFCNGCDIQPESSYPATKSPRSGELSGTLQRDEQSRWAVGTASGDELIDFSIQTLIDQPVQPWPYSQTAQQQAILASISKALGLTEWGKGWCYDPGQSPDVRAAYCNTNIDWGAKGNLLPAFDANAGYCTTDQATCEQDFTRIVQQLKTEFSWVADWNNLANVNIPTMITNNSLGTFVDLQAIADTISSTIQVPPTGTNGYDWSKWFFFALEIAAEIPTLPEGGGAAISLVSSLLQIVTETTDTPEGTPNFSDDTRGTADSLALEFHERSEAITDQMAQLSNIVVSDYGKLSVAGPRADGPWSFDRRTVPTVLKLGARKWAWTQMLAETFGIWGFRPPPPGKRINDLYCVPDGSESQDWQPFAAQSNSASFVSIGFNRDMSTFPTWWWTMGTGAGSPDGPDHFSNKDHLALPGGEMITRVFEKPDPDDESLQSAGLIRPIFFQEAPFIFKEQIPNLNPGYCSY